MQPRWKQCTQLLSVLETQVDRRESSRRDPSSGRLHERWWLPGCTAHTTLQPKYSTGWCSRLACSVSNQTRIRMDWRLHYVSVPRPQQATSDAHQAIMPRRQTDHHGRYARERQRTRWGCSSSRDTLTSRGCCQLRPDLPHRCSGRWSSAQATGNVQQEQLCLDVKGPTMPTSFRRRTTGCSNTSQADQANQHPVA
jgi:hypothetical protein